MMQLARPATLLLAALLASPALWQAFVVQALDYETALTRYVIALPVSAVMLGVLGWLTRTYQQPAATTMTAERIAADEPGRAPTDRRRTADRGVAATSAKVSPAGAAAGPGTGQGTSVAERPELPPAGGS